MASNNSGDFLRNGINGDLLIQNGDFQINTDSVNQNMADILLAIPGSYQQFPNVGCSLITYENGPINGLQSIAVKQLVGDGINITNLNIFIDNFGVLQIEASGNR